MRRFFCRAGICAALFCTNPLAFFRAAVRPHSSGGRELRRLLRTCGR